MIAIIIAMLMFLTTVVLLLQKGRGRMLVNNLLIIAFYEGILGLGAATSVRWALLGLILLMVGAGGIHLLVLFIMALSLPKKADQDHANRGKQDPFLFSSYSPQEQARLQKAMERLPKQDQALVKPVRPKAESADQPAPQNPTTAQSEWEARQKRLLERLDNNTGGELPFDS